MFPGYTFQFLFYVCSRLFWRSLNHWSPVAFEATYSVLAIRRRLFSYRQPDLGQNLTSALILANAPQRVVYGIRCTCQAASYSIIYMTCPFEKKSHSRQFMQHANKQFYWCLWSRHNTLAWCLYIMPSKRKSWQLQFWRKLVLYNLAKRFYPCLCLVDNRLVTIHCRDLPVSFTIARTVVCFARI